MRRAYGARSRRHLMTSLRRHPTWGRCRWSAPPTTHARNQRQTATRWLGEAAVSRASVRSLERARQRRAAEQRLAAGAGPSASSRPGPLSANHEKAIRSCAKRDSDELYRCRRDELYALREVLRDFSSIRRCRWCGRLAAKGPNASPRTPEIRMSEDHRAYYAGVARCGSVWACPVCSNKIRYERGLEIERGLGTWIARGGGVLFLTTTLPHDEGESCAELMKTIKLAMKKLLSGRPYRRDRDRFGIVHWVRTWDATHGGNGWHPHIHAALLTLRKLPKEEIIELEGALYERWAAAVEERGHRRPSREHGILLAAAQSATLGRYLVKVRGEDSHRSTAMELARGDLKEGRGRTPFDILADFKASRDRTDLALFHEWEEATKGQHFMRWSNGAKADLGLTDTSDQEFVEKEVGGRTIYAFTRDEWYVVRQAHGVLARLLRAAEDAGADGVQASVQRLRQVQESPP